jgi:hypothetical protein
MGNLEASLAADAKNREARRKATARREASAEYKAAVQKKWRETEVFKACLPGYAALPPQNLKVLWGAETAALALEELRAAVEARRQRVKRAQADP